MSILVNRNIPDPSEIRYVTPIDDKVWYGFMCPLCGASAGTKTGFFAYYGKDLFVKICGTCASRYPQAKPGETPKAAIGFRLLAFIPCSCGGVVNPPSLGPTHTPAVACTDCIHGLRPALVEMVQRPDKSVGFVPKTFLDPNLITQELLKALDLRLQSIVGV